MITSVEVQGLRGIRQGKLTDLTPLVVLVGPNGSGKSTILDAILIGASPYTGDAIGRAARRRQETIQGARWLFLSRGERQTASIVVHASARRARRCSLTGSNQSSGGWRVDYSVSANAGEPVPYQSFIHVGDDGAYSGAPGPGRPLEGAGEVRMVEPGSSSTPLADLYSEAVIQGRRSDVRDTVRGVLGDFDDVDILSEKGRPILHLVFTDKSVPVSLAGDGVQSLVRTALELSSRPGGVVLLEEPEIHQHPAAIWQTAAAIFTAVRRGVQVIVSTHSLELIDGLRAAAQDDEELKKLSLYRLNLVNGELRSSRLDGMEVASARAQIDEDLR